MDQMMLVKYQGNEAQGFDLGLLGESFIGVNAVLKELVGIAGINGEVEIRTTKITHGSVDLYHTIHVTLAGMPFDSPQGLYDFLQVVSPEMYKEAREFFSGALGVHNDLNGYFASHAFDAVLIAELAKAFIVKGWKWAGKQKYRLTTADPQLGEISLSKAQRLGSMVRKGKFRRVLKPITQGNVRSIKVAVSSSQDAVYAEMTEDDIENYLPEDDQILPQFMNGAEHTLTGEIQNLQSARGEIIKIKVEGLDRRYSLITAKPPDGKTTEDFLPFYHRRVVFRAEVVRSSMYKRPDFVIREMTLCQQELLSES